jgi:hypothetical protein
VRQTLIRHPDSVGPAVRRIVVEVERPSATALKLHYRLAGTIADLQLPEPAGAERTDGLWRHTCFELFLRADAAPPYLEFNLSPSTRWAAYRFTGYREGRTDAPDALRPGIRFVAGGEGLALEAVIEGLPPAECWQLGLAAVIEGKSGDKSYWALAHPPGVPDFHHETCFALQLPAAGDP